jgi:hypothetical protein
LFNRQFAFLEMAGFLQQLLTATRPEASQCPTTGARRSFAIAAWHSKMRDIPIITVATTLILLDRADFRFLACPADIGGMRRLFRLGKLCQIWQHGVGILAALPMSGSQ